MDKLSGYAGKLWGFIISPPSEVIAAGTNFVKEVIVCSSASAVTFGQAVLAALKGVF